MLVNGHFTHFILKKAKAGDFRVQDDFGGMVYEYEASKNEINLAEKVFFSCDEIPLYGRVDIMWDDVGFTNRFRARDHRARNMDEKLSKICGIFS